jgi:tRNA threonylcarbamoyladenosine biosynthesis protein TsaB
MALILNIETSTPVCSVALAENDNILALRESSEEKSHAGNLAVFIAEILNEKKISVKDLDAVAIGKGPGSYTGLRIGVATAKGLAYGTKMPLVAVSTLETLVRFALQRIENDKLPFAFNANTILCPMVDARRMEVYMAQFNSSGNRLENETAVVIGSDTFSSILASRSIVFFGSGASKCRDVITMKNAYWIDGMYPSATAMAVLSYRLFQEGCYEDIAYFEPYYLKDFIATTSRKNQLHRTTK